MVQHSNGICKALDTFSCREKDVCLS